jgi:hypothetical protein
VTLDGIADIPATDYDARPVTTAKPSDAPDRPRLPRPRAACRERRRRETRASTESRDDDENPIDADAVPGSRRARPEERRRAHPLSRGQGAKAGRRAAYLANYEEAGVYASQPLRFDLGHGLPATTLTCDSGPSNDPMCRLLTDAEQPSSTIFEAPGKEFVFLADGEIYVFGQSDAMYDHRRLFRYDGHHYVEAAQPLRYVGIEGTTRAPLALTATRGGDTAHALRTLDAGTPVTILLNAADGDDENGLNPDYLVKTREGLIGWARIPSKPDGTTIVEGLRFNGD